MNLNTSNLVRINMIKFQNKKDKLSYNNKKKQDVLIKRSYNGGRTSIPTRHNDLIINLNNRKSVEKKKQANQ